MTCAGPVKVIAPLAVMLPVIVRDPPKPRVVPAWISPVTSAMLLKFTLVRRSGCR